MTSTRLPNGGIEYAGEIWKAVTSEQSGMPVYARNSEYDAFKSLEKKSKADYNSLYFQNQIRSLNNRHGFLKSMVSKFKVQEHELALEGGSIKYEINSGKAFITDVLIDTRHRFKAKRPAAGLYSVSHDGSSWSVDPKRRKTASSTHIAINGLCSKMQDAAKFMPAFIERGYKPEITQSTLQASGYELFYNPSHGQVKSGMRQVADARGIGGGTEAAHQLAALIEQQVAKGKTIDWTVHERGHAVFKRALKILSKKGLPSNVQSNFENQRVFYANPTMNLSDVDSIRKKMGFKLGPNPPLINPLSIEQTWVTGNAISETHISCRQLKEQGRNDNRGVSSGHIAANAAGRVGLTALSSLAVPASVSAATVGWGLTWMGIAASNGTTGNQKVIENAADVLNDTFSKFKFTS